MVQNIGGNSHIQQILGNITLGELNQLSQTNPAAAQRLLDTFSQVAGSPLNQILGGQIGQSGHVPPPGKYVGTGRRIAGGGYRQTFDLAPGEKNTVLSRMFGGRADAAQIESILRDNDGARAAFEQGIGGRIVDFGSKTDGKFTVERFPRGRAPIPGHAYNASANNVINIFGGMESSVMQQANGIAAAQGQQYGAYNMGAVGNNPFMGLATGGLANVAMGVGMGAMGGMGMGMGMGGMAMGALAGGMGGFGGGFGMLTGMGAGSWNPLAMPGRINNTNPLYERAHQMQVASVLHDPSLTVEDKVTLMLMLIMKKQDRDIERQAMYINSIQQQQSNRGQMGGMTQMLGGVAGTVMGGPMGGMLGGTLGGMMGGGANSPSIDVETMKLKRMIDKRSQMFDMLRQIIDKYNETAKNIIQSIGR